LAVTQNWVMTGGLKGVLRYLNKKFEDFVEF
jgi:hypothetical protein